MKQHSVKKVRVIQYAREYYNFDIGFYAGPDIVYDLGDIAYKIVNAVGLRVDGMRKRERVAGKDFQNHTASEVLCR